MNGAGCSVRDMQEEGKKKTWDSNRFRREHMTFWPRAHPVMYPHLQTDHWSKMKTMVGRVPGYLASIPAALLENTDAQNESASSVLPPLTPYETTVGVHNPYVMQARSIHHKKILPQNMPQYRNMFNDRARMGFCYWIAEKKGSARKGYSFGTYKTFLGLPKV